MHSAGAQRLVRRRILEKPVDRRLARQGRPPVVPEHAQRPVAVVLPPGHAPLEAHRAWRHGGRIEAVITLEIDVPCSWLRRSRKGLWYCTRDTPAERIRRLFGFVELARAAAG